MNKILKEISIDNIILTQDDKDKQRYSSLKKYKKLKKDINNNGLKEPIDVWEFYSYNNEHKYLVINGLTRLKAVKNNGHFYINANVYTDITDKEYIQMKNNKNKE